MVRITEDLIRKRAEHNNCELSTLEEVSLHQQDIERIEHIDKWCRELQILYLQSNLIPKIENVGRLKKLQYLNLALNNIERIENLEGCESLQKLDLTVNFIGVLTSIESLTGNCFLRELYLTGNPCTQYDGYRDFVGATLPQLQKLDGIPIEKSQRIAAGQDYGILRARIVQQQLDYTKKREKEKENVLKRAKEKELPGKEEEKKDNINAIPGFDRRWYTDINKESKPADVEKEKANWEENKQFWDEKVPYTPESRVEMHEHMKKLKEKEEKKTEKVKPPRRLFAEDGRPLNVNEPKVDFSLTENDEMNCLVLDVACFKHLDTSLIDCDVQPNYVRVTIKGKVFQLCLMEEVVADSSTAQRSQITGHLVVKMPRVREMVKPQAIKTGRCVPPRNPVGIKEPQLLEVDEKCRTMVEIDKIVKDPMLATIHKTIPAERPNSDNFVDDPDVPPLV